MSQLIIEFEVQARSLKVSYNSSYYVTLIIYYVKPGLFNQALKPGIVRIFCL